MKKTAFIFSEFNIGGMETSMIRIARSMIASRKYEVTFITTEKESKNVPEDIEYFHISGFSNFFPYLHFFRVLRKIRKMNIDIHLLVYERIFQSVIGLANGIKICLLRNNHPEVYNRAFTNFEHVDGFIGNSPANKTFVDNYKKNKKKIFKFIPNGIFISKNHGSVREKNTGILNLLYVGRIVDESKGVFGLYKVCQKLIKDGVNFNLRIVGEGHDLVKLKSYFDDDFHSSNVSFLPFLDKDNLIKEYKKADILLMPSNYEGLPNVLLEAQLNGCVPIATFLRNSTDLVINDGVDGFLFKQYDYFEMANKIKYLHENRSILQNMSNNAYENIFYNFSSEKEFKDFDQILSSIEHDKKNNKNYFSQPLSLNLFNPLLISISITKTILKKMKIL